MKRQDMRVALKTLGCKINQYESDKVGMKFLTAGYILCKPEEPADILIVNTCTVTSEADRKNRKTIRRMARKNPGSLVVVTGCHAASWSDHLEGVRILKIPQLEKETLFQKVEETLFGVSPEVPEKLDYHTTPLLTRTRAYLKVQDGCDRFCTYCIIPYVRGRSRSRTTEEILNEALSLIRAGYKEIVITGVCVGDFGRDLTPRQTLSSLLVKLLDLPYSGRFRLSSFDPCDMDEKLLSLLTSHPRLCRHLHLALQHGSDRILKRMGRDYTRQEFFILCRELKKRGPDFAVTTDVIAGFPGETKEDFQETLDLAREVEFSKIHVFPYSEREKTGAVKHPDKVPPEIRNRRVQKLLQLSEELSLKFHAGSLGTAAEVLVERERDPQSGLQEGYTSNYIPVLLEGEENLAGELVPVKLLSVYGNKVKGFPSSKQELALEEI